MANTLNWDDEDAGYYLADFETSFDIDISPLEAERLRRVGDLFDLVVRKVPGTGHKCASAMTFYRLRAALASTPARGLEEVTPKSDLAWLDRHYTHQFTRTVEQNSGIRLPKPRLTWIGKLGWWMLLLMPGWFVFEYLADELFWSVPNGAGVAYIVAVCVLIWLLQKWDPGRLPHALTTMRALVEETTKLNYGRLVRMGADGSEAAVWRALTLFLAERSRLPAAEITRDTVCLRSVFDKRYAA